MSNTTEDWDTLVLRRGPPKGQDAEKLLAKGGQSNAVVRQGAAQNKSKLTGTGLNTRVLDENNDGGHIETVSRSTAKAILDGRAAKGLNRKELAQKVNIQEKVLADYESGKAIPNSQVLNKLSNALGIYLTGAKCGQPIEKTSSK